VGEPADPERRVAFLERLLDDGYVTVEVPLEERPTSSFSSAMKPSTDTTACMNTGAMPEGTWRRPQTHRGGAALTVLHAGPDTPWLRSPPDWDARYRGGVVDAIVELRRHRGLVNCGPWVLRGSGGSPRRRAGNESQDVALLWGQLIECGVITESRGRVVGDLLDHRLVTGGETRPARVGRAQVAADAESHRA
jgi:hypothetical protein